MWIVTAAAPRASDPEKGTERLMIFVLLPSCASLWCGFHSRDRSPTFLVRRRPALPGHLTSGGAALFLDPSGTGPLCFSPAVVTTLEI